MNDWKRIANGSHYEYGALTSRDVNRSGLSVGLRKLKRKINKNARRQADRHAVHEGLND